MAFLSTEGWPSIENCGAPLCFEAGTGWPCTVELVLPVPGGAPFWSGVWKSVLCICWLLIPGRIHVECLALEACGPGLEAELSRDVRSIRE